MTKKVTKQLGLAGVFGTLTKKQEEMLAKASEFASYKRVEHERQLEKLKDLLTPYMFNENVVVRGAEIKNGEVREIVLSHFETMMKAMTMYLGVLNMQNKLWLLYNYPSGQGESPAGGMNIKNASILTVQDVQELQKLAKNEPRATDSGTPTVDVRGAIES